MRVVSLVPSATETLVGWGVDVVACTRFCEQPDLTHVGGTKDPDVAAISAMAPDLVVMDREENRREDADALADRGLALHITHVRDVSDVASTLRDLRQVLGLPPATDDLDLSPAAGDRPTLVLIWRRPWMLLGTPTYGSSVIAALGCTNLAPQGSYPVTDEATLRALGAQLVLLPDEPYPFARRHLAVVREVTGADDVRLVDGKDLLWWGTRTPAALGRLSVALGERAGSR